MSKKSKFEMNTVKIIENLGKVLFYIIIFIIPLLILDALFKGDHGSGFVDYLLKQPWYRIGWIGFLIGGSIIVYVIIMHSLKMLFEILWLKFCKVYLNLLDWHKNRKKDQNGKDNISER